MIREVKFESQVSKISKRQTPFAISMVWILIRLARTPSLYASRMQNGLMW